MTMEQSNKNEAVSNVESSENNDQLIEEAVEYRLAWLRSKENHKEKLKLSLNAGKKYFDARESGVTPSIEALKKELDFANEEMRLAEELEEQQVQLMMDSRERLEEVMGITAETGEALRAIEAEASKRMLGE